MSLYSNYCNLATLSKSYIQLNCKYSILVYTVYWTSDKPPITDWCLFGIQTFTPQWPAKQPKHFTQIKCTKYNT